MPIYETACDNLGFALADTEIIVEVQADIQIREPAFDALFLGALGTSPTPAAISGDADTRSRCSAAAPASIALPPVAARFVGLCGKTIETPEIVNPIRGRLFRCETVNRGPWVVLKSDLERRGYLDERHFFQGNDDHDYHRRVFEAERGVRSTCRSLCMRRSPLARSAGPGPD